ncbi:SCO2583/SCO2584 N-terminal domain-containing protein [Yinghuangia soli]|uniref:Uncharacterized protein n=1 Tax=Yinghuangia soli TaxID=2908204 RepID=A0AA41U667_9ACTN|nr:hypothetical protein [Yinghuangia soli]MCF2530684.1 hypothetical protein [Yinghuangia soli]
MAGDAKAEDQDEEKPQDGDPFEGLVLDEDFIRGASRTEGSARARMLAEKWRREPPQNTGFREAANKTAPGASPPRRTSRFRRRTDPWGRPVKRDRTNLKIAVWFVLVAVLLMVLANKGYVRDLLGGSNTGDETANSSQPMTAQPPVTGIASAAAPVPSTLQPIDPNIPTREKPFAGSPAINYADGAAGIALPEAKAVEGYTKDQVAKALETTRQLLIEANLNPATLAGGDPKAYLALLDPEDDTHDKLPAALAAPEGTEPEAVLWLTRFDPKQVELVGPVVKVDGIMSYSVDDKRALNIHADYSFVYAVAKAGQPDSEVTRVIVRRVIDAQVFGRTSGYKPTAKGTVWLFNNPSEWANGGCEKSSFLRPEFASDPDGTPGTGAPSDPYDRSKPLVIDPAVQGCGIASRL